LINSSKLTVFVPAQLARIGNERFNHSSTNPSFNHFHGAHCITMSSYHCPTCHLRFKSNSSLIHHFDNFTVCKRAKPELCRLSSSDNAGVAITFQQVLPISHLSFIEDGAIDIDNGNAFTDRDE
jgi:hypothetical protein